MKKFLAFVSFVLFVSIFVSILPLSVFADGSGNNVALDIPDSSFYNMNDESAEIESVRTFSEEIPYDNINDSYHSQALLQNAQASGNASTYATAISNTKVPNGVYAFKNLGNANRWMDVQQDMTVPGYHMQQYAFGSSPADTGTESGLYIVKAVDSSRYTIRLLLNPSLTFYISGTEVLTKTIPLDDDDVAVQDTFYIYRNGSGYTIRPYGSNYYICPNNTTASGMSGAPDSYLTRKSLSAAGNCARWSFEKYYDYVVDGIYAFKNVGNTNRWMDIEQDKDEEGYHMQQYAFGETSPAESFTRSGLFKVTQVGYTGRYIIRSMLNNRLSFECEINDIYTKEIPFDDDQVDINDTYYIEYDSTYGGYTIVSCDTSSPFMWMEKYVSSKNTQASGMSGAPDSYLTARTTKNANSAWIMEQVVGNQNWGGTVYYDGTTLIAGKTALMRTVTWSSVLGENEPYVSINPEYSTYVTGSWNSTDCIFRAYPHDEGDINICVSIKKNGVIKVTRYEPFSVELLLPEGVCFFKNRELGNYIQIDNNAAPNYESGSILELWDLTGAYRELWRLEHTEDGYYKIISLESSMVLSVPSGYANTANKNIVQLPYQSLDTQLWEFSKNSDGYYVIRPKSAEDYNTDWCLAASSSLFGADHRNVQQREYTDNDDYGDQWAVKYINSSINLDVKYDEGYIGLCNDVYENPITRISNELLKLKSKYLADFGILINYNTPYNFKSYADECNNIQDGRCTCVDNTDCEDSYCITYTDHTTNVILKNFHHTNMANNLWRVDRCNMTTEAFTIAYLGYNTCDEDSHDSILFGMAYPYYGLIGISNFYSITKETKTLVHEVGHIYGVIDHYDNEEDDDNVKTTDYLNSQCEDNPYNDNCIYGLNKEFGEIPSNLTICEGCRRTIEENINQFNHN